MVRGKGLASVAKELDTFVQDRGDEFPKGSMVVEVEQRQCTWELLEESQGASTVKCNSYAAGKGFCLEMALGFQRLDISY